MKKISLYANPYALWLCALLYNMLMPSIALSVESATNRSLNDTDQNLLLVYTDLLASLDDDESQLAQGKHILLKHVIFTKLREAGHIIRCRPVMSTNQEKENHEESWFSLQELLCTKTNDCFKAPYKREKPLQYFQEDCCDKFLYNPNGYNQPPLLPNEPNPCKPKEPQEPEIELPIPPATHIVLEMATKTHS